MSKKLFQLSQAEGDVTKEEWTERHNVSGFEDGGRKPWGNVDGWSLEIGKGKEASLPFSFRAPRKQFSPVDTDTSPVRLMSDF